MDDEMRYKVTWTIDIETDHDSPEDAAREAWNHMQRAGTTANVFELEDETGSKFTVDLDEQDEMLDGQRSLYVGRA